MCHQSVGLIQSIVEKAGIPAASVTLCREITERVIPPRALFVDLPFGCHVEGDAKRQGYSYSRGALSNGPSSRGPIIV